MSTAALAAIVPAAPAPAAATQGAATGQSMDEGDFAGMLPPDGEAEVAEAPAGATAAAKPAAGAEAPETDGEDVATDTDPLAALFALLPPDQPLPATTAAAPAEATAGDALPRPATAAATEAAMLPAVVAGDPAHAAAAMPPADGAATPTTRDAAQAAMPATPAPTGAPADAAMAVVPAAATTTATGRVDTTTTTPPPADALPATAATAEKPAIPSALAATEAAASAPATDNGKATATEDFANLLRTAGGAAPEAASDMPPSASPSPPASVAATGPAAPARFAALADLPQAGAPRIDSDAFADRLGSRLTWMAEHHVGRAEIRVSPPELGTIDISLKLDGKQVRAEFNSAHADVRAALEANLPRLRDMLSSQGLTLAHADVGGQGAGQPGTSASGRDGAAAGFAATGGEAGQPAGEDGAAVARTATLRHDGLLDEYA